MYRKPFPRLFAFSLVCRLLKGFPAHKFFLSGLRLSRQIEDDSIPCCSSAVYATYLFPSPLPFLFFPVFCRSYRQRSGWSWVVRYFSSLLVLHLLEKADPSDEFYFGMARPPISEPKEEVPSPPEIQDSPHTDFPPQGLINH